MEFEEWKDEAACYLEDAGIAYSAALDEKLFALWQSGTKPHEVIRDFAGSTNIADDAV